MAVPLAGVALRAAAGEPIPPADGREAACGLGCAAYGFRVRGPALETLLRLALSIWEVVRPLGDPEAPSARNAVGVAVLGGGKAPGD